MFEGRYTLWGAEHSLFTRKLQALLNAMDLPYEFRRKVGATAADVEARVGTHFIPALETPEGWFIHDTTPIGLMLDAKHPSRRIVPTSPVQRIACHLLEDWADEWFGRYAIHTRWCYPDNVEAIAPRFMAIFLDKESEDELTEEERARALEAVGSLRDSFGLRACTNRGCASDQAASVRADFDRLLDATAAHWAAHPYLLGDRACLGDFTFAGVFKAHYEPDPEPRAWVDARAPQMIDVMDRVFRTPMGDEDWLADDALPATLDPFFEHMAQHFHAFLRVSRDALAAGEKWCEVDLGDGPVRMRSLKYSEISRRHIRSEILALSADERAAVDRVLGERGVLDAYLLPPLPVPA